MLPTRDAAGMGFLCSGMSGALILRLSVTMFYSCRTRVKFTVSFVAVTDSIQKFVDSYARVGARDLETGNFFDAFYKQFVNSSPIVADKFRNTDMDRQRDMLKVSLDHMVYFAIDREETEEIARVAGVHSKSRTDIPHQLYELWLESLLATVARFDDEYDAEVEAAWREALGPAIEYMKRHYEKN